MLEELLSGVDDTLPDQTSKRLVQGRVLIYDADSLCYRASAKVAKLKTGVNRFQQGVLEQMYYCEAETAKIHLTHKDSEKAGRSGIIGVKPYQANRTGNSRPELLHALRDAVSEPENILEEYTVQLHKVLEADDACMIDSYKLKQDGILMSEDKDLRQTPYPFYDNYLGKVVQATGIGSLWLHTTPSGSQSLHGIGRIFFWAQMMMGDTADNIQGLLKYLGKSIGFKGTYLTLQEFNDTIDESVVANLVIDAYRGVDQNPYPEGYLLHMMRDWGDSFHHVVEELKWSSENKEFLEDCLYNRVWYKGE